MSFELLLMEFGLNLDVLRPLYENLSDQIPFDGEQLVETKLSSIDGIGIFSRVDFEEGDFIALARENGLRTPAGRYTNHADVPNATISRVYENLCLKACRHITAGEEILIDYRQAFGAAHE